MGRRRDGKRVPTWLCVDSIEAAKDLDEVDHMRERMVEVEVEVHGAGGGR